MTLQKPTKIPEDRKLKFAAGDLIIKEGDYGVSVYRILKGKVKVYKELSSGPMILAELQEGEIFGDMAFIDGGTSPRATSVRASTPVEVEVWHPVSLGEDYKKTSPIIKLIANQLVKKLGRINAVYDRLALDKAAKARAPAAGAPRKEYRKKFYHGCTYRPADRTTSQTLKGTIIELGKETMTMEVPEGNTRYFEHVPGSSFDIYFKLPDAGSIMVKGRLEAASQSKRAGFYIYDIKFEDVDDYMKRKLTLFVAG